MSSLDRLQFPGKSGTVLLRNKAGEYRRYRLPEPAWDASEKAEPDFEWPPTDEGDRVTAIYLLPDAVILRVTREFADDDDGGGVLMSEGAEYLFASPAQAVRVGFLTGESERVMNIMGLKVVGEEAVPEKAVETTPATPVIDVR